MQMPGGELQAFDASQVHLTIVSSPDLSTMHSFTKQLPACTSDGFHVPAAVFESQLPVDGVAEPVEPGCPAGVADSSC
jgi:hypothetical protein